MNQFAPVTGVKAFQEAVNQIVEEIQCGSLTVGDRLPPERVLSAEMEISRPTLREALRVLAGAGVLDVRRGPGGGTFVRSEVIPLDLLRAQSDLLLSEVADVLDARRLLEPHAAQLAGLYASEGDFQAMQRAIDLQRRYMDDDHRKQFLELDLRFHLAIARASGNKVILAFMKTLVRQLAIAWDMAIRGPHEPERMIQTHEDTLRAIRARNPDAIEAAMDEHLTWLENFWDENMGGGTVPDRLRGRSRPHSRTPRRSKNVSGGLT